MREASIVSENIRFSSGGDIIAGTLFLPEDSSPAGALILCHGAMDFKENYFELCEFLAARGIAALAIDMHGNGQSQGERFHVNIAQWTGDISAAIDFLTNHQGIDKDRIGAFGLSSGGTAVLECAAVDQRIRALVTLDATVRNTLRYHEYLVIQVLILLGRMKRLFTGDDLRLSMVRAFRKIQVLSDPQLNAQWAHNPRIVEMWSSWPMPGAAQSLIVDTISRVHTITAPTLVLHGAEDRIDPPESAHLLYCALTCEKQLRIIPGNGHVGHLDRNKGLVMQLTADWALTHLHP